MPTPPQPEYGSDAGFDPRAWEAAQRAAQERAEAEQSARRAEVEAARAAYEAAMAAERAAQQGARERPRSGADPRWPTLEQVSAEAGPARFHSWSLCLDSSLRVGSSSTLTFAASAQPAAPADCPGQGVTGVFEPPATKLAVELASLDAGSGLEVATVPITNAGTRFRWSLAPSEARRLNLRVQYAYVADGEEIADFATLNDVPVLAPDAPSQAQLTSLRTADGGDKKATPTGLWALLTALGAGMGGLVTVLSNIEKLATMTRKHGGWLVNFLRRRAPTTTPAEG
ncbi:MAG: hypothetical protein KA105_01950 [Caulobacter sp.]|nr:hypothetical protein [Caulobacter sp.]